MGGSFNVGIMHALSIKPMVTTVASACHQSCDPSNTSEKMCTKATSERNGRAILLLHRVTETDVLNPFGSIIEMNRPSPYLVIEADEREANQLQKGMQRGHRDGRGVGQANPSSLLHNTEHGTELWMKVDMRGPTPALTPPTHLKPG